MAIAESSIRRWEIQRVAGATCTKVGEDGNDGFFAHNNGSGVRVAVGRAISTYSSYWEGEHHEEAIEEIEYVHWVGFVGNIGAGFVYGLVADLVDGCDKSIECGAGIVAREPDGFAI